MSVRHVTAAIEYVEPSFRSSKALSHAGFSPKNSLESYEKRQVGEPKLAEKKGEISGRS
ncbi:MAG: hypothetical protein K0R47_4984 [Brevibacillus sp.]|jgi:hypothetical protein|nr:hypothetical protein [Brevibacillus sp.]